MISQPNPFSNGETMLAPRTSISAEQNSTGLAQLGNETTLAEVIAGLNALGVSTRDMIDILKSIKAAGALHADFVVR